MFYTKMDNINCIKRKIEKIIEKSSVPEDPVHSRNTLEWLLKLEPNADVALQIAALGHDIERAVVQRKVNRQSYKNYDDFKYGHSLNSAKILSELMEGCNISRELINDVTSLVSNHETGGDKRSDILKNADSISFFHVNLPYYFERNSFEETKKRYLWGYRKLPVNLKMIVAEFNYDNKKLESLINVKCLFKN